MPDPYEIIGVRRDASLAEIRIAYRRSAQILHPDRFESASEAVRNEAARRMRQLNQAMEAIESDRSGEDEGGTGRLGAIGLGTIRRPPVAPLRSSATAATPLAGVPGRSDDARPVPATAAMAQPAASATAPASAPPPPAPTVAPAPTPDEAVPARQESPATSPATAGRPPTSAPPSPRPLAPRPSAPAPRPAPTSASASPPLPTAEPASTPPPPAAAPASSPRPGTPPSEVESDRSRPLPAPPRPMPSPAAERRFQPDADDEADFAAAEEERRAVERARKRGGRERGRPGGVALLIGLAVCAVVAGGIVLLTSRGSHHPAVADATFDNTAAPFGFSYPSSLHLLTRQCTQARQVNKPISQVEVGTSCQNLVLVAAYRLPLTVESNGTVRGPNGLSISADAFDKDIDVSTAGLAKSAGLTQVGAPRQDRLGTLTARAYDYSKPATGEGTTFIYAFRGSTEYFVSCKHTRAFTAALTAACGRVQATFAPR